KNKIIKDIKTPQKHILLFAKEKRRGKIVTIVQPFFLPIKDLKSLLKSLKKEFGTGGAIKENTLEFQGELHNKLRQSLTKREFRLR
ncbi:MAG: translation initiation factor, partial [Sulfurovum sp.]|nr:translation initiation factor [Sulfurovaceae bacterium]